jgi:type II secretory pathway component PulF
MPAYTYTAKDREGRQVHDFIEANSRYAALAMLREDGMTVLAMSESAQNVTAGVRPPPLPRAKRTFSVGGRVKLSEKSMFCRQLSVSVGAGVPLRDALESIAEDMENPALKRALEAIVQDLHNGKTFSESLKPHGQIFQNLFVSLIKTAEESGSMSRTLEELANSMEKSERLLRKVRSVTAYPTFVAIFFCIVSVIMTLFVIPQFQRSFESFGSRLPLLTRTVFRINGVILAYFPYIAVGIIAAVALLIAYVRTEQGRLRFDALKLKLPLVGQWIKKSAVSRFCRNLSMMVRGGVPITTSIEIASGTTDNKVVERSLRSARDSVINGASLTASLAEQGVFPRLVLRMVNVGESSGRLPEVLEKVSDVYEEEVEASIITATTLFEPIAITFFGAVILVIVLAIYVPVFTMASHMR